VNSITVGSITVGSITVGSITVGNDIWEINRKFVAKKKHDLIE